MRPVVKQLIILLVLDIACGAGLWFGYTFTAEKKISETELRADLAEERDKNSQLSSMQKMLVQAEERHQQLAKYLYSGSEVGQIKFLSEIERLGRSVPGTTLDIGTFEYSKGTPPSFNASVSFTGTYGSVYHMLRLFEEYPANITITRMEIRQNGDQNAAQWTATIAFSMHGVIPEPK